VNRTTKDYQHKAVSIGDGAIILELSKPRIAFHPLQDKSKLCEVHVKAPDGFGILAYVQEAYLRENTSETNNPCKDYIQFGQNDKLPFITLVKSRKVCGHLDGSRNFSKGFMYDDPHGNLLIWVNLWGRQKTSHWPAIYTVNITLVLTAYQTNCGTKKTSTSILKNVQPPKRGFKWCGVDPGPCISQEYFCDKRFNCIGNSEGSTTSTIKTTHDELSCRYIEEEKTASNKKAIGGSSKATNKNDKHNINGDHSSGADQQDLNSVLVDPNALNTISWVLIGICTFLGILLILILAIGCTKNTFCRRQRPLDVAGGECFQHERNLADLSANRLETEPNVYLPLETFREQQEEALVPPQPPPPVSTQINLTGSEEPPPSYDSLFPTADASEELNRASSVNE